MSTFKSRFSDPYKPSQAVYDWHEAIERNDPNSSQVMSLGINAMGNAFLGNLSGMPSQLSQAGGSLLSLATSPYDQYKSEKFKDIGPVVPTGMYSDFRSRYGIINLRADGVSAARRSGGARSTAYAAASAVPVLGAYSVFNRETIYGWGDHGNPTALRRDFTARSHVATKWDTTTNSWVQTKDSFERSTPFRGDKVSVIDFSKRKLENVYNWTGNDSSFFSRIASKFSAFTDKIGLGHGTQTKDFVKFYITGPKIRAGGYGGEDDIIVFRASFTSITDSFSGQWNPIQYIGRGDNTYQYSGYMRDFDIQFKVFATSKDELKPIWRKLNYLASYTAPIYNDDSFAIEAPWMRITVGDLLVQQPVALTNVTYTIHDGETPWEINIEDDNTNMEVPFGVDVNMRMTVITDYLPEKGGNIYTLSREFDTSGPKPGDSNWLSDSKTQERIAKIRPIRDSAEFDALTATAVNEYEREKFYTQRTNDDVELLTNSYDMVAAEKGL